MSTQVEINGVTFLPIKEAAKLVSYTHDYVARLAREQKIVATQIGRNWFVDIISLRNFVESSLLEQSIRHQQLSLERKREQVIREQVQVVNQKIKGRAKTVRLKAQLVATLVLCFGLLTGATLYTTTNLLPREISNVTKTFPLANTTALRAAVNSEANLPVAKPQPIALYDNAVEYPLFVAEAETRALTSSSSEGIFLLARGGEVKSTKEVQALFSDEVAVEFKGDNTGSVIYTLPDGEVVEYPFVSVPVKSRETASSTVKAEVI